MDCEKCKKKKQKKVIKKDKPVEGIVIEKKEVIMEFN